MSSASDTGATVTTAINVLSEHGVKEENIIILTLFCTPEGELSLVRPLINVCPLF
jgi:uracil phosphoribosyltransferase